MARVFSPEAVAQGQVPTLEAFPLVVDRIRSRLMKLDDVLGAVLCGSVMELGRHSRRMDVDCFVFYQKLFDSKTEGKIEDELNQLQEWSATQHVPLSFILRDQETVEWDLLDDFDVSVEYHFAPYFLRHLEWAAARGGIIKADPIPKLREYAEWDIEDEAKEIDQYCDNKVWYLTVQSGSWGHPNSWFYPFLSQVLSAPFHVARKTIEFFSRLNGNEQFDIHCLTKAGVLKEFDRIVPIEAASESIVDALRELIRVDVLYDAVLEESLARYNADRYQRILQEIESIAPCAVRFLRGCRNALPTAAYFS